MTVKVNRVVSCVDCDKEIRTPMANGSFVPLCDPCLVKSIDRSLSRLTQDQGE